MKKFLTLLLAVLCAFCFVACGEKSYQELDLYYFGDYYSGNIIKAEEKYLNEYVCSQGYVSGIKSDKFWLYADEEQDLNKYSHFVCFFDKSNKDLIKSILSLKNGDKIKVYGKIIKIEDSYPTDNLHMQLDKIEVII